MIIDIMPTGRCMTCLKHLFKSGLRLMVKKLAIIPSTIKYQPISLNKNTGWIKPLISLLINPFAKPLCIDWPPDTNGISFDEAYVRSILVPQSWSTIHHPPVIVAYKNYQNMAYISLMNLWRYKSRFLMIIELTPLLIKFPCWLKATAFRLMERALAWRLM